MAGLKYSLVMAWLLGLTTHGFAQDTNFFIILCFGQSNMEGFPGIEEQDKSGVDSRFQVFATVDFPKLERKKGNWYQALPPLCRPSAGLCPADYFGRTMASNLPTAIKVGVVNVSVAGCKIELFDQASYQAYTSNAPPWMKNIIKNYDGNPYQHLVDMARLAQKDGVIKGILLHQGESNNNDKQWPNKVKGIYERLLKDLNLKAEEVPLLAGGLVPADQKGACASMNKIIEELPSTISTAHFVSSDGCPSRPDHLHFTAAGYRELGTRYGLKMLSLLGYQMEPSGAAPRTDRNSQIAHQQLLEKARKGGIDVYFVGDSIARRWDATDYPEFLANWNTNFFGWNAADFGWGADLIENMLWRLENGELDGVHPKIIVLLAGINNVGTVPGGEAKVENITRGLKALVSVCQQKAPDAIIILTALFPRNDSMAVIPEINRINDNLANMADGKKIRYLNVNDRLAGKDGKLFEGISKDKLHPSLKGYQVWADGLKPIFTEILGPPAKTDHAPPPTGDPSAKPRNK